MLGHVLLSAEMKQVRRKASTRRQSQYRHWTERLGRALGRAAVDGTALGHTLGEFVSVIALAALPANRCSAIRGGRVDIGRTRNHHLQLCRKVATRSMFDFIMAVTRRDREPLVQMTVPVLP
jgi:hypothetical protein